MVRRSKRRRRRWLPRWRPRHWWRRVRTLSRRQLGISALVVLGLGVAVLSYIEGPPRQPDDICAIFNERRGWYHAARRSFEKWGVPESVQMAVIYHESSFRARVRPRRRILWVLPGPARSSAYGYAQVLDSTWQQFRDVTGQPKAGRHRFPDVTEFIGWYGGELKRIAGVTKTDPYNFYLAYHEGPGGYARGSHLNKPWLLKVAKKVESRASMYQRQYEACEDGLRSRWRWRWVWIATLAAGAMWWVRRAGWLRRR